MGLLPLRVVPGVNDPIHLGLDRPSDHVRHLSGVHPRRWLGPGLLTRVQPELGLALLLPTLGWCHIQQALPRVGLLLPSTLLLTTLLVLLIREGHLGVLGLLLRLGWQRHLLLLALTLLGVSRLLGVGLTLLRVGCGHVRLISSSAIPAPSVPAPSHPWAWCPVWSGDARCSRAYL